MKIERTKEWWLKRAQHEGDSAVGAGLLALDPKSENAPAPQAPVDETRIAFGRFVSLMRRRHGYSIEQLAAKANIEIAELISIEDDLFYKPEVRTVYQLSVTFDLPQQRLAKLAGLIVNQDNSLREDAIRFAARSESTQKLTPEENAALEEFIAVLSKQGTRESND